ncbi:MAG: sulfite oxidase [Acetobacteraceae bacterium]|nr:sulfite oxidase [Acetobacteraceae bacterium]
MPMRTEDPDMLFDRAAGRRGLLRGAGLAAMGAALGMAMPFGRYLPQGMLPLALAQGGKGPQLLDYPGKDKGLVVLGDKPLVAETPEYLLNDDTTPADKFFIRNNGQIPDAAKDPDGWKITVEGEVDKTLELTLGQLKQRFPAQTHRMVLECGGNGRAFFTPPGRGNQWTNGGIGCAEWTGVKLADVLHAAGLKDSAKFTGSWGTDPHLSGDPAKRAISRGNVLAKSLEPHTMIVWAMNGQPLPNINGGPVRLLVPGWPGSLSTKWLSHVLVRATPHDGQGMGGTSYRVPVTPIVPGSSNDGKSFRDLEAMPIRSIVTAPANGTKLAAGTRSLALRGAAWGSAVGVARVEVSVDFGQTWQQAAMTPPRNPFDWVRWTHAMPLPSDGYFEVWSRATDRNGVTQPIVAANWNPQGYGSNPINRIAVLVG